MAETKALLQLLERHYIKPGPLPGGVFVPECGINGSTGAGSRADALYVGFTSTSGRLLVGHEIKVSRSDWRKELDTAGKADFWADNCHQWLIVAPGPEIVPKEEIPHGWGLMYPSPRSKTRMQIVVKPVTHADRTPEWNAVRSIMARLDTLRAHRDHQVEQAALEKARKRAAEEQAARAPRALTGEQRDRLAALDRLEEILGKPIAAYVWGDDAETSLDAREVAAAIKLIQTGKALDLDRDAYATRELRRLLDKAAAGLDAFGEARAAVLDLIGAAR